MDYMTNILEAVGGLALFLFGMNYMGEGLEHAAGSKLKTILEKLTKNRILATIVGIVITAIIQSSSATIVMAMGFVNAGLMNLAQTVGIVMGANIGTTVTGQLLALNVGKLAPVFAIIGVVLIMFFGKKKKVKYWGQVIVGFGILFIGMSEMSSGMKFLGELDWFKSAITSFKNPIIGILFGFAFSAITQSSSVTIGILQALALGGLISLDSSIYIIFGQNIGACVITLIASASGNKNAKRTAMVHLLFNIFGTIIFMIFLSVFNLPFVEWVDSLTPDSPVNQIANAHTIFKVITTIILLPFGNLLAKLATIIIPGEDASDGPRLMHINKLEFGSKSLGASSVALAQVEAEIDRMHMLANENLHKAIEAFFSKKSDDLDNVYKNEETIDFLNHEITKYLIQLNSMELSPQDAKYVSSLFHIISDIERIGDHAENIADYARQRNEGRAHFTEDAKAELREISDMVYKIMDLAYDYFKSPEGKSFEPINSLEQAIDDKRDELEANHIKRLNRNECEPNSGMIFVEIVTDLERISDHALNIAQRA